MILSILLISLVIMIAIGMPIAWSLGISGLMAILLMDINLQIIPQELFSGMDSYLLVCIPFFILAGDIMLAGGLTERLFNFAVIVLGFIRGGLALANVLASMLFGGLTGSAIADASGLGSVEIPMMVKDGYNRAYSAAITAASACIGPIIPPSNPMVVYAMAVSGTSIGGLFAAGLIPGVLVGIALMTSCYIIARVKNHPKRNYKITVRALLVAFKDAFLSLMMPVIILGGILGGIFTPTEASGVAVVYAFIISFFVYRHLRISDLPHLFIRSGMTAAIVLIIIATSRIFAIVVTFEQVALKVGMFLEPMGYYGFLLLTNIIFLIIGTTMDLFPAIVIFAPILAPIAFNLGIHPLHFGIIVVMNLVIGLLTPPLGEVLFVVAPIARVSLEEVVIEVVPFLLIEIAILFLITYIPFISLYIPRLLGYA